MPASRRVEGVVLALLTSVLWGFAPVASKRSLAGCTPELVTVVRLGVAAACFRCMGGPGTRVIPGDRWTLLAGVGLGIDFLVYNYGLGRTSAGVAGLVVNLGTLSTALLARWLLGEALTARRLVGGAMALAGVLFVASEGLRPAALLASGQVAGNALVMLAAVCWSVFAVAQRRAPRDGNLFRLMAPIFTVAATITAPLLLRPGALDPPSDGGAVLALAAVTLLSTVVVYALYARGQECLDLTALAVIHASVPAFAVVLAWWLLGEPIGARVVVGGAVILAGIVVTATER